MHAPDNRLPATAGDSRTVIGWREYVALPEWGIPAVKAKVDTGARTSAIDVASLEELPGERARFDIVVDRNQRAEHVTVETAIVRRTRVRSSFGRRHDRLVVNATVRIGEVEKTVELGLVCRKHMLCRMLLGRAALEPEFLVDPHARYRCGGKPRRRSARPKEQS